MPRLIADTLIKEFLLQSIEQRMNVARSASDFLRDEADKLKAKLEQSDEKLQRYKEEHNAVSLDTDQNIIVEKLNDLNKQVTEAKSQRIRLESDMQLLRSIRADDAERMLQIPSVSAIPQVQTMRTQIVAADTELAAAQKRYGPMNPKFVQAVTQVNQMKEALKETLRNAGTILSTQYQSATDTEKKLNESLREQEQTALELNKIAVPYNVLAREVESDRIMYEGANTRLRETTVAMGIEASGPLCGGTDGRCPCTKRSVENAGHGPVSWTRAGRRRHYWPGHARQHPPVCRSGRGFLNLPVLAVVSKMEGQRGDRIPNVFADAHSQQAEAFRNMRTTLSLLGDEDHRRVFLITSAVPGEGKTFCAFNAAMAFALEGQRTVLVDADLRMPALHRIFPDPEVARDIWD